MSTSDPMAHQGAPCGTPACPGRYQSDHMYTDPGDQAMGSDELHYHQFRCPLCGRCDDVELRPAAIPLYTQADIEQRQRWQL
jgi:hypothetical protein